MQKIQKVGPELRVLVQHHEEGTFDGGVEALNSLIESTIEKAGLWTLEIKHVSVVGVHPHNREKAMLVPVDCHDLLFKFAENGFNPKLWDALACTIPHGAAGDEWRGKNAELVDGSEGQLAEVDASSLEIVTGRGSHGTAALRLVAIYGARSIHKSLADTHGNVSKAMLLQQQPSWEKPLEQGLVYRVFPGELELEVPGLLAALSRLGNAHHDVFRQKTALQMCNRIHSIMLNKTANNTEVDTNLVAQLACQGNGGSEYMQQALQLTSFVQAWSGGRDGHALRDLENFERSCSLKRKLAPADLAALASVDLLHAPQYVTAACFNLALFCFLGSKLTLHI